MNVLATGGISRNPKIKKMIMTHVFRKMLKAQIKITRDEPRLVCTCNASLHPHTSDAE
jgi:hypothetical protein